MEEPEAFKPLLTSLGELQITTTTVVQYPYLRSRKTFQQALSSDSMVYRWSSQSETTVSLLICIIKGWPNDRRGAHGARAKNAGCLKGGKSLASGFPMQEISSPCLLCERERPVAGNPGFGHLTEYSTINN